MQDLFGRRCRRLSSRPPVVLNFAEVGAVSSIVIGAVTIWKRLQASHHRLVLVGMQAQSRNTLALCRLDKLFEFCDTEEEAKRGSEVRAGPRFDRGHQGKNKHPRRVRPRALVIGTLVRGQRALGICWPR